MSSLSITQGLPNQNITSYEILCWENFCSNELTTCYIVLDEQSANYINCNFEKPVLNSGVDAPA
jgi:hypothetical protein